MARRGDRTPADLAEEVLPRIVAAVESAYSKTTPILNRGRKLAKAKMQRERAAFNAQPVNSQSVDKEMGTMLKKLLLLAGLIAVGGFVAKKLTSRSRGGNWQSSYTPPPAPTSVPRPAAVADEPDEDLAAATPDEALSDRAAEPHPDTTPDDPAEEIELAAFADTLDEAPDVTSAAEEKPAPDKD